MRNFRRLPPLLRVVSVSGLLLLIAALAILVSAMIAKILSIGLSVPLALWGSDHIYNNIAVVTVNLSSLGGACAFVVNTYSARFRQPDRATVLLNSWQSQARTLAWLAAPPLCALALTLIIPPDSLAYLLVMALSMFAAIMLIVAYAGGITSVMTSRPMRSLQAP